MKHLETEYKSPDGVKLYLQAWMPEAPRASLLLVHGLGEHSGRYESLVQGLVDLGVAVFTFDGRGHGKSSLPKPTAYFDSYERYLEDIDALAGKVKNYIPGLPFFMFGHSMGGGLVAAYVLKYQPDVAGIILSAPAIKEAEGTPKILIALSGLLNALAPKLNAVKLDIEGVSRIAEEVEKYKNDPLIFQKSIPVRTGYEVYQMMQFIQSHANDFVQPVLILHGTADRLTNPKGSELLFEKAQSQDRTLKIIPGAYHELLNDSDREEVLKVILGWLKNRIE
jgi:alpha-beta hydrolase superfamily lysophospholipase